MRNKAIILLAAMLWLVSSTALGQMADPVRWSSKVELTGASKGTITFTAAIDDGWHMYALRLPSGGPSPLSFNWTKLQGVKLVGELQPSHAPHSQHDDTFDMQLSWWTGAVSLTQRFAITQPAYSIAGTVNYMACNDVTCTAPAAYPFSFSGKGQAEPAHEPEPSNDAAVPAQLPDTAVVPAPIADTALAPAQPPASQAQAWAPVPVDNGIGGGNASTTLWYIFLACFAGGILALFTPCVWPIIPLTVSFFLKKSASRGKAVKNALLYGASIIVIYLVLGLLVTALFGASELNAIATNAVCNIIFFLMLVVFAISFFGAFDIKLPDSWSTRTDVKASNATGVLSIFFMAFTLVIVSFSCTGPIIGTLLVEAATASNMLGPAIGMLGFSLALAIPFALFAMFPTVMKRMPKSGSWLNTVKVVLGFLELALSLKFLSVADMAYGWHLLPRETFLALWIAIFLCLGLYLLGVFRFKSDGEQKSGIGVARFMLALASLAFTAYLVPGLWGAPLKATSAFVPPLWTQDFNLNGDQLNLYDDYDAGLKAAAQSGKPVFIDFSGYGCVNCRKMEGAVLDAREVKTALQSNFVSVRLMVDDKTPLPQPITVVENGRSRTLATVGDKWSYLQRHKFRANTQPYYVVLDAQGRLLSGPYSYKEDVQEFLDFLNKGLNNAKQ